jgi:hypothetical protein
MNGAFSRRLDDGLGFLYPGELLLCRKEIVRPPVSPDRSKRSAAVPREETDDEFQRTKHLPAVA